MISQDELTQLAALARLALDESERATLAHDLDLILDYVDQLKQADFSQKVRPFPPKVLRLNLKESENVLREDGEPHPPVASRQFKVKAVFNN